MPAIAAVVLLTAALVACGDDGSGGPGGWSDVLTHGDGDGAGQAVGSDAEDTGPGVGDASGASEDGAGTAGAPDAFVSLEEVTGDDEGGPIPVEAHGTWEVSVTPLVLAEDIGFAAPLGEDMYLVQHGAGVVRRHDLTLGSIETLEGEPGAVHAAATVGPGVVLIAGAAGLFVVIDGALVLSPLDELLSDVDVTALAAEPSSDDAVLWLTTDEALHLLEGGELFSVTPDGLPTAGARIAWGTRVGGDPALWVAADEAVYALTHADEGGLLVAALRQEVAAAALAADGDDLLWVALEDGDLQMREADGSWTWFRLPGEVEGLLAHPGAPGVWLDLEGAPWFSQDGDFGPLSEGAPSGLVAVDDVGRGVAIDDEGVWLLAVGDAPTPPDVEPPGWAEDVEPLFLAHCEQCHGATGFAHPMFTRDIWIEEIDLILTNVSTGAMPLPPNPPLGEVDIQRIEAWQDAGFPE